MRIRKSVLKGLSVCFLALSLSIGSPVTPYDVAYAQSIDNDLAVQTTQSATSQGQVSTVSGNVAAGNVSDILDKGTVPQEDIAVGNFIKNHRGMTGEQLAVASNVVAPLTTIFGYITGGIVSIACAGIFLITALDIAYITLPPVRNFLYTPGTDGTGAVTAGRGGYGGYGGYGGMSGGGNQQTKRSIQLISDEAVQCAALFGGSSASEGIGNMPRVGGGYGASPQNQMSRSSVIKEYLLKRAVFIVLFAICIIVLTSSILLGTGVNLAQWGIKLIDAFNSFLAF